MFTILLFELDDEEDSSSPTQSVSQPAQQAVQQGVPSPISSDPAETILAADAEGGLENTDDVSSNVVDGQIDGVESDAKDPVSQDQAATIDNSINPVGNEAIIEDDDDGKLFVSFNNYSTYEYL